MRYKIKKVVHVVTNKKVQIITALLYVFLYFEVKSFLLLPIQATHGLLFPQHNSVVLNALNMGMCQLTGFKELLQTQEAGLLKS